MGYMGQEETQDWTEQLDSSHKKSENQTEIQLFKVAFKSYTVNPYLTDPQFPYPNQTNKVIDPAIYLGNSTEKINLTQDITHKLLVPTKIQQNNQNNVQNNSRLLETTTQQDGQFEYKCASKQADNIWNKQFCEIVEKQQSDRQTQIKCICKDLSPTTIGEEFVSIFTNNKNIDAIMSIQGLQNIQQMEWYKYAIFYIGGFITLAWIYLLYYGFQQDKLAIINIYSQDIDKNQESEKFNIDKITQKLQQFQNNNDQEPKIEQIQIINQNENKENQQLQEQNKQQNQVNKQQQVQEIKQIEKLEISQNNNNLIISGDNKIIATENQNEQQVILMQSPDIYQKSTKISRQKRRSQVSMNNNSKANQEQQQQQPQNLNQDNTKNINNDASSGDKSIQNQLIESRESNQNIQQQYKLKINDDQEIKTNQNLNQKLTETTKNKNNQEKSNLKEIKLKFCNKNFAIGVFSYHEFLSIFHISEPNLKRPVRFTIFYIKVVYFMTITSVFSQQLNAIQNVLFSALSGIAYSTIVGLISQLLKRVLLLKIIGSLILLGFCGICWYSILVVAATIGIYDSNMWAIQFTATFFVDNFVVQLFSGIFKYSLLIILIQKITNMQGIVKAISGAIVNILLNAKIKALFSFD